MLNYITRTVFGILIIFISSCSTDENIPEEETLTTYNLTTNVSPEDSGSISTSADEYEKGEEVSLEAIPVEGFIFKEWEGGAEGQDNPVKFTMDSDKTITAVFEKVTYSLSIDILGKWFITTSRSQEKTSTTNECTLISIEFQADGVFIIMWPEGLIRGTYTISGNNSLDLGIGTITNLDLSDEGVLTFVINLEGGCSSALNGLLMTYVPDDVFEQELINQGYDDVLDNVVNTRNIETIIELDLGVYEQPDNLRINDLTGIEDFTALEFLNLYNHNLTTIDFSNNINLGELNLTNNNLNLIDLSKNVNLFLLGLDGNNLSEINLSSNPKLTGISIESNNLTSIDLSNNRQLQEIYLSGNKLATLDLSGFEDLFMIWANDNNLESLNISNSPHIIEIYVQNNNLDCIQVDEEQLDGGNISIFEKDEDVILSTDCNS